MKHKQSKKRVPNAPGAPPGFRGKGDYSPSVLAMSTGLPRLEAKIDHIEKVLGRDNGGKTAVNRVATSLGRVAGNALGVGDLGANAGSALARYFGHGDYTISTNSLMVGASNSASTVQTSNHGKRGVRFQEREYLGDIVSGALSNGSSIFTNSSYALNPTNPKAFPWLSNIAALFDQWEPNGIVFEYRTTSSDFNGSGQALGAVIMATDYDAYDVPYSSKINMENADYANSSKPSMNSVHGIECDVKERPTPLLYTSTSAAIPLTSTQLGNFQVATQGCTTAGVTLGELWISYDITFYKKQATATPTQQWFLDFFGTSTAGLPWLPAAAVTTSFGPIVPTTVVGTGTLFTLNAPPGTTLLLTYYLTSGNADTLPVVAANNVTYTQRITPNSSPTMITTILFVVTGANPTFTTGLFSASASTRTFNATLALVNPGVAI